MNSRLVWNFEISNKKSLNFNDLVDIPEEIRWEARFFWPEEAIISLDGLDLSFLNLANYKIKERHNHYFLLPDCNFNIKERRSQLFYKPLLQEDDCLRAYGQKINLSEAESGLILPGTEQLSVADLLKSLKNQQLTEVSKVALIYKFPTTPSLKLELARLIIAQKSVYFSLCIEGKSQNLVGKLAKQLLGTKVSCDYVSFLKQALSHVV